MGALLAAGVMLAQSPRAAGPTQYPWWNSRIANSLELSDAQTKKLNEIQQAYVGTLKDLNAAVTKAETNLNEIYNQVEIDDLKAGVAVDQYVNARDNLTRVLSQMSLKMRGVLTIEQWQQLENLQNGRAGRAEEAAAAAEHRAAVVQQAERPRIRSAQRSRRARFLNRAAAGPADVVSMEYPHIEAR